eukprot:1138889-Prorocentrum_minimum.AAC.5
MGDRRRGYDDRRSPVRSPPMPRRQHGTSKSWSPFFYAFKSSTIGDKWVVAVRRTIRDDRRGGGMIRRGRSPSPPRYRRPSPTYGRRSPPRRRSPPAYDGRSLARRHEERESDRYPRDNFPREPYAGVNAVAPPAVNFPPPPHIGGENGSRPGAPGAAKYGLMTYRQFMITLPEYITPAESAKKYDEYLAQHAKKARMDFFHSHRHEDWLKAKFHPSSVEVTLQRRNERALELFTAFASQLKAGTVDLQDHCTGKDKADLLAPPYAACERRSAFDLRRSRELILQLDKEKGIPESLPELVAPTVRGFFSFPKGLCSDEEIKHQE